MPALYKTLLFLHVLSALWMAASAFAGTVVRAQAKRAADFPGRVGAFRIGESGPGIFFGDAVKRWFLKRSYEANATGFRFGIVVAESTASGPVDVFCTRFHSRGTSGDPPSGPTEP